MSTEVDRNLPGNDGVERDLQIELNGQSYQSGRAVLPVRYHDEGVELPLELSIGAKVDLPEELSLEVLAPELLLSARHLEVPLITPQQRLQGDARGYAVLALGERILAGGTVAISLRDGGEVHVVVRGMSDELQLTGRYRLSCGVPTNVGGGPGAHAIDESFTTPRCRALATQLRYQ